MSAKPAKPVVKQVDSIGRERESYNQARLFPVERRAQAAQMLMKRIFGAMTYDQLAADFNVSTKTVTRRLEQARIEGVPEEARTIFIREMLPKSMAVLQEVLESGDQQLAAKVALKVIDGLKVLDFSADRPSLVEESFESYRIKFNGLRAAADSALSTDGSVIDVEASPQAGLAEAGNERAEELSLPAASGDAVDDPAVNPPEVGMDERGKGLNAGAVRAAEAAGGRRSDSPVNPSDSEDPVCAAEGEEGEA